MAAKTKIIVEETKGKFPVWLAPLQVKVLPVSEKNNEYATKVYNLLADADVRAVLDDRNEKVGYKIREAQLEKVPYMLILGDKEKENGTISVRHRSEGDLGAMTVEAFTERLAKDVREKILK